MRLMIMAGLALSASFAQTPPSAPATAPGPRPGPASMPRPGQRPRIRQMMSPDKPAPKPESVPPNTPVVTLTGLCSQPQAKGPCKTVVTREDLDRFINAFAPEATDAVRARMAVQYARTLAFSTLAEQKGLTKSPTLEKEIEDEQKLVRMRILAAAYLQTLQRQTTSVPEIEIQKYYNDHPDRYEQVMISRLSVPFAAPNDAGGLLDRVAVKTELEQLRLRALAGEDLNLLQQEAYKHFHIQATPPEVTPTPVRRGTVQGDDATVFDMKPGEISPVLDSAAAYAIVRLESKQSMPVGSVHKEIEAALMREHAQTEVGRLSKRVTADFNLEYLGMPVQPDIFAPSTINPLANRSAMRQAAGATHQ